MADNEGVTRILLEYGADPNARDSDDQTPLHRVVEWNRTEVARVLLENGVDVNARDVTNRTPLHVASELDGVQLLLHHSADVHARDDEGRTPFQDASASAARESQSIMRLLLEHGAEDSRT